MKYKIWFTMNPLNPPRPQPNHYKFGEWKELNSWDQTGVPCKRELRKQIEHFSRTYNGYLWELREVTPQDSSSNF